MPWTKWPANSEEADGAAPPNTCSCSAPIAPRHCANRVRHARLGVTEEVLTHLVNRYGSEARTVIAMMEADPQLGRPLLDGLPYLRAEAVYAARYEMAWTLDDVLSRRTRARLLAREASAEAAADVARLIAPELGWSPARADTEVEAYRDMARRAKEAMSDGIHRMNRGGPGRRAADPRAGRQRRRARRRRPGPGPPMTDAVRRASAAPVDTDATAEPVRVRFERVAVTVDDAMITRLRSVCARVDVDETSRLRRRKGLVAPLGAVGDGRRGPGSGRGGRPARHCDGSGRGAGRLLGGPHPRDRGRRPKRRVWQRRAALRRRGPRHDRTVGHRRGGHRLAARRRPGRHLRRSAGSRPSSHPRPHPWPLAAVDRPVNGRWLAGLSVRRPVLHPVRKDRGHGRRPRGGAG